MLNYDFIRESIAISKTKSSFIFLTRESGERVARKEDSKRDRFTDHEFQLHASAD